jgi:hypothetical protein
MLPGDPWLGHAYLEKLSLFLVFWLEGKVNFSSDLEILFAFN